MAEKWSPAATSRNADKDACANECPLGAKTIPSRDSRVSACLALGRFVYSVDIQSAGFA